MRMGLLVFSFEIMIFVFSSKTMENFIRKQNQKERVREETMKFKILVEKLEEVSPKHPAKCGLGGGGRSLAAIGF